MQSDQGPFLAKGQLKLAVSLTRSGTHSVQFDGLPSARRLDGNLGVCIQFSSTHFAKKRKANDQQSAPRSARSYYFTSILIVIESSCLFLLF